MSNTIAVPVDNLTIALRRFALGNYVVGAILCKLQPMAEAGNESLKGIFLELLSSHLKHQLDGVAALVSETTAELIHDIARIDTAHVTEEQYPNTFIKATLDYQKAYEEFPGRTLSDCAFAALTLQSIVALGIADGDYPAIITQVREGIEMAYNQSRDKLSPAFIPMMEAALDAFSGALNKLLATLDVEQNDE